MGTIKREDLEGSIRERGKGSPFFHLRLVQQCFSTPGPAPRPQGQDLEGQRNATAILPSANAKISQGKFHQDPRFVFSTWTRQEAIEPMQVTISIDGRRIKATG